VHTLMSASSILGGCCSLATLSDGSIAMTSSCAYAIMSGSQAAHSRPKDDGLSLPPPAQHAPTHAQLLADDLLSRIETRTRCAAWLLSGTLLRDGG
jgi:hypothetical protein